MDKRLYNTQNPLTPLIQSLWMAVDRCFEISQRHTNAVSGRPAYLLVQIKSARASCLSFCSGARSDSGRTSREEIMVLRCQSVLIVVVSWRRSRFRIG